MDTLPETLPDLLADFPLTTSADWRAAAERAFGDAAGPRWHFQAFPSNVYLPILGITEPPAAETPTRLDPARCATAGWRMVQRVDHPDPVHANGQIRADLAQGVRGFWLCFDRAARLGVDPDDPRYAEHGGAGGIMACTVDDLDRLLAGVDLAEVELCLDAGGNTAAVALALLVLAERRGVPLDRLRGAFHHDPLGALVADGGLASDVANASSQMVDLAHWSVQKLGAVRSVAISTLPYHMAGAAPEHEVAWAVATGLEYFRALYRPGSGYDKDALLAELRFVFGIGREFWTSVAKLRAARRVWAKAVHACGGDAKARAISIHAVTSRRSLARRDPLLNQVRATVETIAAVLGGAEVVTTLPFDGAIGPSDDFSRRLAAHTQTILQAEAQLDRIADAAGGSGFLEALTDGIARLAWWELQGIEGEGGMARALLMGRVHSATRVSGQLTCRRLRDGEAPIIGVSLHRDPDELPLVRPAPDLAALRAGAAARMAAHRAAHSAKAVDRAAIVLGSYADPAVGVVGPRKALAAGASFGWSGFTGKPFVVPARIAVIEPQREEESWEAGTDG
jgi:methylmalonyl-CoA mutase